MDNIVDLKPNWISSPSQTIIDVLREKKLDTDDFIKRMDYSTNFINSLLSGQEYINGEVAEKLEKVIGASKNFWIKREIQYREYLQQFDEIQIKKWIEELPIKDMLKNNWIPKTSNLYQSCLDFFAVKDYKHWQNTYNESSLCFNFRTSKTYKSNLAPLATWIRQGEIQGKKIDCEEWNSELFLKVLYKIKPLTRLKKPQDFLPELISECAKCGVAIAIVPNPMGSRASGATKFLNEKKALMILSFKFLSDDHFWFTFFHEAGHLIMKHKSQLIFIDIENEINLENEEENEANIFAEELLIPEYLQPQLKKLKGNARRIISFAQEAGVSPGIVIGQMQHHKYIGHNYLNSFKRHYDWEDIFESISNLQSAHN